MKNQIGICVTLILVFLGFSNALAQDTYKVSNYSYQKVTDGSLEVSMKFQKDGTGRILKSDLDSDNTILCAKNLGESVARAVVVSGSTSDNNEETKKYRVEVGVHNGQLFRLVDGWKTLNFHIEVSTSSKCQNTNLVKEPATFDLQINRNFDSTPTTEVSLGDSKTWVAIKQGDNYVTTYVEIELMTSRCDKMSIELKSNGVTVATKNTDLCESPKFKPISLDINKTFDRVLLPNQTCDVWVNGKKIGTFNLLQPLSEYKINKLSFFDNGKTIEESKNSYTVNRKDGEKKFEVISTTSGDMVIEKPKCVKSDAPIVNGSITTFRLNFQECSEKLLSFRFKGKGNSNQPFLDTDKTYIVRIDNETHFKGYVSFDLLNNSPIIKYQLTRDVDNEVNVVARLESNKDYPLQIRREISATSKTEDNYVADFPQSLINALQNDPKIQEQIKAGKKVPIIFKIYDKSPDASKDPIGEFEVQAFGINSKALNDLKASSQKFNLPEALKKAKEILNLPENGDMKQDESDAVNRLAEIIKDGDTNKRTKTLKILSIVGSIGARFLGIPLSF
jgi:hypothetical protein